MQKLNFSISINAPKEKVWDTMLDEKTYTLWTEPFSPGSYYKGSWDKGSKILFLGTMENKGEMGMVSRIADNRKYEYISIEHLGEYKDGVEDTTSDNVKQWAGAKENYTFREKDGKTEVLIDLDIDDNYCEMFQEMWPKALHKLKEIAEK